MFANGCKYKTFIKLNLNLKKQNININATINLEHLNKCFIFVVISMLFFNIYKYGKEK